MYLLVMAIRPDALPTDPAALSEMVLALDAENEKLRVAMQTLKEMIFGTTLPVQTNDDIPAPKPSDKPRKKARRNIGALSKHLPRCEQVLEPEATACPCCQGQLHKIGEDVSGGAGRDPGHPAGAAHDPSQVRLPQLHRRRGPGKGAAAPDQERHGVDGARDPRGSLEVRLVSAAIPAGADSGRSGHLA